MIWKRLRNLWRLSQFESGQPTDEYKIPGTQIVTLIKKPESVRQSAVFIPRTKVSSIEQITKIAEGKI